MLKEAWKPVVGYEGWYEVSDIGRVRRVHIIPIDRTNRILKNQLNRYNGYQHIVLSKNGVKKHQYIHRLVGQAFLLVPTDKQANEINHKNGVRTDNKVKIFEWVTRQGNVDNAIARGTAVRGERVGGSKLTEEKVKEIRRACTRGEDYGELSARYGISKASITLIKQRKNWKHVI